MFCFIRPRALPKWASDRGQTTVEAAYLLPLVLMLLLLVAQPVILLYDRAVMRAAAAEGCRLLSTRTGDRGDEKYVGFIKRRLGSVPPVDIFHVHAPCSWDIELVGDGSSDEVSVSIKNKLKPLPLVGTLWTLGLPRSTGGTVELSTKVSARACPAWVQDELIP